MVSKGLIQPNDQNTVVEYLADIVGLAIIMLTTVVSLTKVVKHKHPDELIKLTPSLTDEQSTALNNFVNTIPPTDPLAVPVPQPVVTPTDTGTPPQTTTTGIPNVNTIPEQQSAPINPN